MSKRCPSQKDVNVKHLDCKGGSQKSDLMRFTDIDINFDVTYDGHQKTPNMPIERTNLDCAFAESYKLLAVLFFPVFLVHVFPSPYLFT